MWRRAATSRRWRTSRPNATFWDAVFTLTLSGLSAGSVGATELATDAVTTAKIAANAVTTAKIADGAITSAKIADGTIATADLADGAVSNAKMANVPSGTIKGRATTAAGAPEDLTRAQAQSVLGVAPWTIRTPTVNGRRGHVRDRHVLRGRAVRGRLCHAHFQVRDLGVRRARPPRCRRREQPDDPVGVPILAFRPSTRVSLWLVEFDDAGTPRMGVVNCRTAANAIFRLGGQKLGSSTAISGTSNSAHVFLHWHCGKQPAFTIIARLTWNTGLAALGTWTAPDVIEVWHPGMKLPGDIVQTARIATRRTPA